MNSVRSKAIALALPLILGIAGLNCGSAGQGSLEGDESTPSDSSGQPWRAPEPFESAPARMRRITRDVAHHGVVNANPEVPRDAQALAWPSLHHPLVPAPIAGRTQEDTELRTALEALSADPEWQGSEALRAFVDQHEDSRWTAAAALSLGDFAYSVGRFSQALRFWWKAWELAQREDSVQVAAVANQAIAEYAKMNARVGRMDELTRVFALVEGRTFSGDAAVKLDSAREGLWAMEHKPGVAFKCGPYALTNVLRTLRPDAETMIAPFLEQIDSPPEGFSLNEVAQMAGGLNLPMRPVFREPGSEVVIPSVVHWGVGHFGALLEVANGRYRLVDPTFGNETWMTAEAIDAESSGYFLIPDEELLQGFRAVDATEGSGVFGKGHSGTTDPDETGPDDDQDGGDDDDCAMATYSFHTLLASLTVSDTPVKYAQARGPEVAVRVTYNQREASQPVSLQFSHFSPNWVSTWVSYLEDTPSSPTANVKLRQRGGGGAVFTSFNSTTQTFKLHSQSRTRLQRLTANTYVLEHEDGSREYYEQFIGTTGPNRRVFLSRVVDPAGNEVSLRYDTTLPTRLNSLVDPVGLTTTFAYARPADPYLVTTVEDPFGRQARFTYSDVAGITRLSAIEDAVGIVSSFTYDSAGGITRLTTPYGATNFELSPLKIGASYDLIRYIEATDPQGNKERIEYNLGFQHTRIDSSVEPRYPDSTKVRYETGDLDDRNSFYWDKQQMKLAPRDYRAAKLYHWVQPDGADAALSIKEAEKNPLEGRIWYNYAGQSATYIQGTFAEPSVVGRVVVPADGTTQTQVTRFDRNGAGRQRDRSH
jgi:hypothetical protein